MSTLQILFLVILSIFMFGFFFNIKILYLTKDNKYYFKQIFKIINPFAIFFIIAFVLQEVIDFQFPEFLNIWTILSVFIFPFVITISIKIDPGWKLLQIGKRSWQTTIDIRKSYKNGEIIEDASKYENLPGVKRGEELIIKSINLAINSNINRTMAIANKAIAHQELGLLYRAINKFDKAGHEYDTGLSLLDKLNISDKRVIEVYREIFFRKGELYHVTNKFLLAIECYEKSLDCDNKLGHDEPIEEKITKRLLDEVKSKRSNVPH